MTWAPGRRTSGRSGRAPDAAGRPLRRVAKGTLAKMGYDVARRSDSAAPSMPQGVDPETAATVRAVQGYTLTPPERVVALCEAVRYVVRAGVSGAFAECGVWRGGSCLAILRTLCSLGVTDRDLYLYDTFESMPPPGPEDVDLYGVPAATYHERLAQGADYDHEAFDYLPFAQVQALLHDTGYPPERLHFVKGLVEDTLPDQAPRQVCLLRLDTDYYQSTRHELFHLFPRMQSGGVLLIDDYGYFEGCKKATDEYIACLAASGRHLFLSRIDFSARLAIVP
jgi:O-methyltransferase